MNRLIPVRTAVLLGGLYITQFMGLAFVFGAVPAILRSSGASLDTIALFTLIGFFWALKMLWAPLVDRFGSRRYGHYRSWLISLQSLLALAMLVAGFFEPATNVKWLAVCVSAISLIGATQDLAADGLAVIILGDEERGLGNGIQTSGGFIGHMIGSGIALIAYDYLGWAATMWILAAATCLPLVNIIAYKEPSRASYVKGERVGFSALISFFKRSGMVRWLPVLLLVRAGIGAPHSLITPLLVDKGWTLTKIAVAITLIGGLFGISGAVAAGIALKHYSRKRVFLVSMAIGGIMILGLWRYFVTGQSDIFMIVLYGFYQMAYAAVLTAFHTAMMDKCAPASAATDFSLQYCISLLVALAVAAAVLPVAERFGYETAMLIGPVLLLAAAFAVYSQSGLLTPKQFRPLRTSRG